jgi:hypothetical protein
LLSYNTNFEPKLLKQSNGPWNRYLCLNVSVDLLKATTGVPTENSFWHTDLVMCTDALQALMIFAKVYNVLANNLSVILEIV